MGNPSSELHTGITDSLRAMADPKRAKQQQAYMKSAMPFLRRLRSRRSQISPFSVP